jgi:hypothetical protein
MCQYFVVKLYIEVQSKTITHTLEIGVFNETKPALI